MNKALEPITEQATSPHVVTSLNLLIVHRHKEAVVEMWPEISDTKLIYNDPNQGVVFIDIIEAAIPSNGKGGEKTMVKVKLKATDNRVFADEPLSLGKDGPGQSELHNSIFSSLSKDKKTMKLGFQYPSATEEEFDSCVFSEIYFITVSENGVHEYKRFDPSVVIIRG